MVKLKKMVAIPRAEDNGKTQEKALAFRSKRKGKADLLQRCHCNSPNMWPWKFSGVPSFTGLAISEIIGLSKKLGSPWICLYSLLSKIFNGLLFGWTVWMFWPHLKSVALPIREIIAIGLFVLGWGLWTPNLGEKEAVWGRGLCHSKERWSVPKGPP